VNILSFVIILVGVLLNAVGQLLLKAGANALKTMDLSLSNPVMSGLRIVFEPHIFGGLVCYVISVGVWLTALTRVPVSVAYPMLSIGYVLNAVAAYYLFGEVLSGLKLAGIGVIILGVVLVARS
jgi:multidrug transporter EmrE-like cation transporter